MSTDDKKINVDDITFDDMLDGGIEDAVETLDEPQVEEPIENEEPKEQVEETSLDADVETKRKKIRDKDRCWRKAKYRRAQRQELLKNLQKLQRRKHLDQ